MTDLTLSNLLQAFIYESINRLIYDFYSGNAKKEGYIEIEKTFLEFSDYSRSHAKNFLKLAEKTETEVSFKYPEIKIANTAENLKICIKILSEQINNYEKFAVTAEKENLNIVAVKFRTIKRALINQMETLNSFMLKITDNSFFEGNKNTLWICMKCGYVYEGEKPPEKCPACDHPKGYFRKKQIF